MELFLNFVSPNYGMIRITEPEGFDAYSYNVKQPENRFGRDKSIGAKEIDLNFWDGYRFEKLPENEYQITLNGTIVNHLSMQLERILEAIKEKGSEAVIEFIVSEGNETFSNGYLDILEGTTDGFTYFKCNVVQDTAKALIERKKDIKADVFSTTDTFGNPQTPLNKTRVFINAPAFRQVSTWKYSGEEPNIFVLNGDENRTFNLSSTIVKDGIEKTLSFFPGSDLDGYFAYIEAQEELTDIDVEITNLNLYRTNVFPNPISYTKLVYVKATQDTFSPAEEISLSADISEGYFNNTYSFNVPYMARGEKLWIYFRQFGDGANVGSYNYGSMDVKISATSTALSTVTNSAGYFDFLEKGIQSVAGLGLAADEIKTGEFKDQFVCSGNDLRLIDNSSLNFVFKDEMQDLKEINADYQINDGFVEILTYPEFYKNIEIASFDESANEDLERTFNTRFKPKLLEYKYETYEQDRDEINTRQGFETEAQFDTPMQANQGKMEVSIKHVRDFGALGAAQKDASKNTTALTNDDKIFILDCVPIAPNTRKKFSALLLMQLVFPETDSVRLKILAEGFNWITLGFRIGDVITITGQNAGDYSVFTYDTSVLELIPLTTLPVFQGGEVITFDYPLTDVQWQTRQYEGFTDVSGLEGSISNLKYSIKRNLSRVAWSSYLASWNMDCPEGSMICTYFRQNGELESRFMFGELLKENDPIPVSGMAEKILNKHVYKTTLRIGFLKAKQLIEDTINKKGFIRFPDKSGKAIKMHLQDMDASWFNGTMVVIGEARNESEFINIESVSAGIVNIIETGYPDDIDTNLDWYKITNGYVQLFDNRNLPLLSELLPFTRISVNGMFYNDEILFVSALSDL